MSMNIYATIFDNDPSKAHDPVIDFRHWDEEILAPDADARADRGESAFIDNPAYIPNAGMILSNANARAVFAQLGYDITEFDILEIDAVQRAVMRGLNGDAADYTEADVTSLGAGGAIFVSCGIREGYMRTRLKQLLALVTKGRVLGATHILVG